MAQPYVGEIRMFAGNFNPNGWMFCEGQLLPISENETLFQLIGTMYGGDGESTFALPDLRGRIPLHFGTGPDGTTYQQAETGGVEQVTLTVQQIPVHTHAHFCFSDASGAPTTNPQNAVPGVADITQYNDLSVAPNTAPNAQLGNPGFSSAATGGSQPHENFQPYLCINYIISLFGIFPSPT
ncbi:MAG TPA: tail fiber protein [Pyrinomonadaceae bacterium]|nr:tail fiber protein [Pyrinomonadaceae bacterium]